MTPGDWWIRGPVSWLGLRRAITATFAMGSLIITTLMSTSIYLVARTVLLDQRETAVLAQAYAEAAYVRDGLRTVDRPVAEVLGEVSPPAGSAALLHRGDAWYSTSLAHGADSIPVAMTDSVTSGAAVISWVDDGGDTALVVGIPLHTAGAQFYVVSASDDLDRTLLTLARVSIIAAILAVVASGLLGRWAAARVLGPLHDVADAAARIASGDLKTRLPRTTDPDLVAITGSFNAMVAALSGRIERDARFSADVSHELRSPLTTLTTAVQMLQTRRDELPERSQKALDLMSVELVRFRSVLEGLLELGRLEAGVASTQRQFADLGELVQQSLVSSGRGPVQVEGLENSAPVRVDKRQIDRALVNLMDNADLHGDGLARIVLTRDQEAGTVSVHVHDAGQGVDPSERERIFERFARGTHSRGSRPGSGLGLSLVAEMLKAHGGGVTVSDSEAGGAVFTLTLPVTEPEPEAGAADGEEGARWDDEVT